MPATEVTGNSTYLDDDAKIYIEGIRKTKRKMEAEFDDFNAIMQKLAAGNGFIGSAGSTFFAKYDSLKKEYSYFEQLFNSFANDFQQAVEHTEETNKAVESAVYEISDVK